MPQPGGNRNALFVFVKKLNENMMTKTFAQLKGLLLVISRGA